jgi:hypothetical protein
MVYNFERFSKSNILKFIFFQIWTFSNLKIKYIKKWKKAYLGQAHTHARSLSPTLSWDAAPLSSSTQW